MCDRCFVSSAPCRARFLLNCLPFSFGRTKSFFDLLPDMIFFSPTQRVMINDGVRNTHCRGRRFYMLRWRAEDCRDVDGPTALLGADWSVAPFPNRTARRPPTRSGGTAGMRRRFHHRKTACHAPTPPEPSAPPCSTFPFRPSRKARRVRWFLSSRLLWLVRSVVIYRAIGRKKSVGQY